MPNSFHTAAAFISDIRMAVWFSLGYIACVGTLVLVFKKINNQFSLTMDGKAYRYLVAGEYAVSLVIGSYCWYVLTLRPALLWIPIGLFLLVSL